MADLLINFKTAGDQVVIGALRNIGGGLVNLAGNALGAATDAFADFAKESFSGAIEAQKGIDELNASIAHLGDKSPITADKAMELADQFKNLVGGSDDVVLAMQNVGLRFSTISGDLMPRFIEQSADLATALGLDPVKASQMLGKVLEDLGTDGAGSIGKLTAAGVQLTDAQKDQILKMVEMGDVAGAQNLVLDALAETTGGKAAAASETLAGKMAIFQETIADAGEGVAMALLPGLTELAGAILPIVVEWVEGAAESLTGLSDAISWAIGFLAGGGSLTDALLGLKDFSWEDMFGPEAANMIQFALDALIMLSDFTTTTLIPALGQAVAWVQANWPAIQQAIADGWAAAQPVLQAVWDFIQNTVIPGFKDAVDWVVENWPTIQAKIDEVMAAIQGIINTVLNGISDFWNEWGDEIQEFTQGIFDAVKDIFSAFDKAFKGDWRGFGEDLRKAWDGIWEEIKLIVGKAIDWFLTQDWGEIGTNILKGIADGITAATHFITDAATAAASAAFEAAKGFLGIQSPSKLFASIGQNMMLGWAQGINANAGLPAYATMGAAYATTISVGGIVVNGAGSPLDTAGAIESMLEEYAREGQTRARLR